MYRLCGANHRVCECTDLESQPCIAALVECYLDTLRWGVLTGRVDGGPGDEMEIGAAERNLHVTSRAFPTIRACERWSIQCGCGGFLRLER
jgi:hypothetical protein